MKISYGKNVYGLKEIEAVTSQLRKTTQMGKSVTKFEKNISKKFSKSFGLMVNSGSSAIMLALKVLNLNLEEKQEIQVLLIMFLLKITQCIFINLDLL